MQTIPPASGPIGLKVPAPAGSTLRVGQVFQAVVRGGTTDPFLQLPTTRIPLAPGTPLPQGQAVRVEILETGATLRLQLTPQPGGGTPGAAPPAAPLDTMLAEVLRALGKPGLAARAAGLTPSRLPVLEAPLRQLFTVLLAQPGFGDDLRQLGALLQQASPQGAIPPAWLATLAGLLGPLESMDAQHLRGLLAKMGNARTLEARLALALQAGAAGNLEEALGADLKALLAQLRDHGPLREFLVQSRQAKQFDGLLDRLLDRVQGGQQQNLNALERPYVFLDLPVATPSGLHHAQVHFFGDAHAAQQGRPAFERVVLDCSTSQLGDLWVELQVSGVQGACRFRAATAEAAAALEGAAPELREGLAEAGFPGVDVHVAQWDGDRLNALLALMRPFHGVRLDA